MNNEMENFELFPLNHYALLDPNQTKQVNFTLIVHDNVKNIYNVKLQIKNS